ncbi:MAG: phosphatidylglycerol lysyltransferase domain-containing protein [Patescibacteria group bacterium]
MVLPRFPEFIKIDLTHIEEIASYTSKFPPYNDFEFLSLWTYNSQEQNAASILNGNLVVKMQDFTTSDFFYSFLGSNHVKETITTLLAKSKEAGLGALRLVPEANLLNTSDLENYFKIEEDPDSFDYILSVADIAELTGSKYHDKRNLVKKFKKLHPTHSIELLDLREEKTRQHILDLFTRWEKYKGKDKTDTDTELQAIKRLFDVVDLLHLKGIGIYVDGVLVGFSTYHTVHDNFAILSFQKGDTSYPGIYEYLNHESAKHLRTLGSTHINYEQDLGIAGLRKAKQLWRPVTFHKKYTIGEK